MVDWKAVLSGKSIGDIENRLSQLTDAEQQQALQLLGNGNAALPPIWRLVILNNKDRYPWGKNGPHELGWQRNPTRDRGDNTLVYFKSTLTYLRIGLLPLGNQGPSQQESVTITLHYFAGESDAPITEAQLGRAVFVNTSPSATSKNPPVPTATTQVPRQDGVCPWGRPAGNEEALAGPEGLVQRVRELHTLPDIQEEGRVDRRIAALTQANADQQVRNLTETTFKFFFNLPNRGDTAGGNAHTLLYLRITLVNDPRVTVRTEPFRLLGRGDPKDKPEGDPKDKVTGTKRPAKSAPTQRGSTRSPKVPKGAGMPAGAGTSAGAGSSSLGAAGPSSGGLGDGGADDIGGGGGGDGGDDGPDGAHDSPTQAEFFQAVMEQQGILQMPGIPADAALPLPDLVLEAAEMIDNAGLGELGDDFAEEALLDDDEGGGAGHTSMSAGGADSPPQTRSCAAVDSAPSLTSCSAAAESPPRYRGGLGGTSGGDAGGEAGLESQQSAMRRVRRAMRDNAKALLLAILRAAGAQQQQQPGATPLAQLREELEDLKAWLGL